MNKKDESKVKNKQIKIRVTQAEYDFLQAKAEASKMTMTDFIWSAAVAKQVKGYNGKTDPLYIAAEKSRDPFA